MYILNGEHPIFNEQKKPQTSSEFVCGNHNYNSPFITALS